MGLILEFKKLLSIRISISVIYQINRLKKTKRQIYPYIYHELIFNKKGVKVIQ